jgi:hypothetical protein
MINGGSYWIPDMDGSRAVFNRVLGLSGGEAFVADATRAADGTAGSDAVDVLAANVTKPLVVAIKYPKGCDKTASNLEALLADAGYKVRYKWLMPVADCQHEQIIQMSARADEDATSKMRKSVPQLSYTPVVLQLEGHPLADFTIVVSPETQIAYTPQHTPVSTAVGSAAANSTAPVAIGASYVAPPGNDGQHIDMTPHFRLPGADAGSSRPAPAEIPSPFN